MLRSSIFCCGSLLVLLAAQAAATRAAEIRLRRECQPQRSLVMLGDVADVFAADPDQKHELESLELIPTVAAGTRRQLSVGEIQDLLRLRGINLNEHRFSGSSRVILIGSNQEDGQDTQVSASVARRGRQQVEQAIRNFLDARAPSPLPWTIDFELSDEQAAVVARTRADVTVRTAEAQPLGRQTFQVGVSTDEGPVEFALQATVGVPPAAIVAAHSIPRGATIREGDLALQPRAPSARDDATAIERIEDVVGKQAVRAIPAGRIVTGDMLRRPILVRKGSIVTVYARSRGVQVRVYARSRDDGSEGDLVSVESLEDRQMFLARVSGVQEVEVFARAVSAEGAAPAYVGQTHADVSSTAGGRRAR